MLSPAEEAVLISTVEGCFPGPLGDLHDDLAMASAGGASGDADLLELDARAVSLVMQEVGDEPHLLEQWVTSWEQEDDQQQQQQQQQAWPGSADTSTSSSPASSSSSVPWVSTTLSDLGDELSSVLLSEAIFGDEVDLAASLDASPSPLSSAESGGGNASDRPPSCSATPPILKLAAKKDPKTKLYHCQVCGKSFEYVSRLERHMTSHEAKRFQCSLCDKLFSRADVLLSHKVKVHKEAPAEGPAAAAAGSLQCPRCPARLKSQHHLQRHLRSHDNREGHFVCSVCSKQFQVKHKFQRHLRLHLGERRFECGVCGLRFLQKEFLNRHMRTHSGEEPFICSHCGRGFKQEVNLRAHIERLHTAAPDRRAHSCPLCSKAFVTGTELRNHLAYHSGQMGRVHRCPQCPASFYEKRHRDRHLRRVHTRIKNVFCAHCGRTFYEKYELNHHLKSRKCLLLRESSGKECPVEEGEEADHPIMSKEH